MNNMNIKYNDIFAVFVLNILLHHVGMPWIIETQKQLKYDINKNITDWMTGSPWYNTYICKKIHGTVFWRIYYKCKN